MAEGCIVRKKQYYDSVFLMSVNKRISDIEGVSQSAVLMGSDANKRLLADLGFQSDDISEAGVSDLIVAVTAISTEIVQDIFGDLDMYFTGGARFSSTASPHTFEKGLEMAPNANLAVISVPGEYAPQEATKALDAGVNVFLFSDNVSVGDELELKRRARDKDLIVMGPDCGTSIIGGIGVGFANAVRRGNIGAIGVSGTGLQEFTCLIHNAGAGISHAIGTGGRDLSDQIGGLTTTAALDALESDRETDVIALISKPPGEDALMRVTKRLETSSKPIIACFLGECRPNPVAGAVQYVSNIDDAVTAALQVSGRGTHDMDQDADGFGDGALVRSKWSSNQKYLRGVFAGGTFCYQSQQILREAGFTVQSNAPLLPECKLPNADVSSGHTIIDMGADEFTTGRPHPMIDGSGRARRILTESHDPEIAILLLDIILGYNSSPTPVEELIDSITEAMDIVERQGGHLEVVASICGTDNDFQNHDRQTSLLREVGVRVYSSSKLATDYCVNLLGRMEA
jgi:FdrA protein